MYIDVTFLLLYNRVSFTFGAKRILNHLSLAVILSLIWYGARVRPYVSPPLTEF